MESLVRDRNFHMLPPNNLGSGEEIVSVMDEEAGIDPWLSVSRIIALCTTPWLSLAKSIGG
jgi:hypothetical protein